MTLGNFATKLLRDDQTSITKIHGQAEVRVIGRRAVRLFPVLHPAAALYTPSNREVLAARLRADPGPRRARAAAAARRRHAGARPEPEPEPAPARPGAPSRARRRVAGADAAAADDSQLGLF